MHYRDKLTLMVAIIPSLSLSLEMSFLIAFLFLNSKRGFINLFCPVNSERKRVREKRVRKKKKCLKNSTPLKSYYFLPFSYRLYWILVYVYFIIKRWAAMFKLVFCFSLNQTGSQPNLSYYTAPTFQLSWVAVCSYLYICYEVFSYNYSKH